jgi:hypothetical protein
MRPTLDHLLADRRRMEAYIASRIPEEGCRIVVADGPDGEGWVDLDPVRYGDGEWGLHWETNCTEWAGISQAYEHFRRQEITTGEWGLEMADAIRQKTNELASRQPACTPKGVLVDDSVTSQRNLITPKECQRVCFQNKVSLRQVYCLFYLGEIDGFRVGRKVLLFDDSVEAYIGRNRNKSASRDSEPERDQEPKREVPVEPIRPKERPQRRQSSGFQFFHLPEGR